MSHPRPRPGSPRPVEAVRTGEELLAAGFANLVGRPAREVDRAHDTFVAEGPRLLRDLLDRGWPLRCVLLSERRARSRPDLLADASDAGSRVIVAGEDLIGEVVGYDVHRGALAIAERPEARSVASVVTGAETVLVVEGVNDHENLGALFRNAAALGAGAVVLDPSTADPLYRRSVRVSLGHVTTIPFARAESWPAAIDGLRRLGLRIVALSPAGAVTVDEEALLGSSSSVPRAVMVGSEGSGLSTGALRAADVTVRIPVAEAVDSLNVATAAAVALHTLRGAAGARRGPT